MDNQLQKYLKTFNCCELLKKYILEECGVWEIRGEDSNCDLCGPHSEPRLDVVEGRLEDVLLYAVNLDGFWSWGYGGSIIKMSTPKKLENNKAIRIRFELLKKEEELKNQLEALKKDFKNKESEILNELNNISKFLKE